MKDKKNQSAELDKQALLAQLECAQGIHMAVMDIGTTDEEMAAQEEIGRLRKELGELKLQKSNWPV